MLLQLGLYKKINHNTEIIFFFLALQTKLNEEKCARQKADQNSQEKERQISMLSVDYRQIQQRLQKLEGEFRQVNNNLKTKEAF